VQQAVRSPQENARVRRLMLFFAVVFVVEGIGQARVGIVSQPLTYYLKQLGWAPLEVTAYLALLNFPWIIKPVFGLVSDFIPLFGYRRKSYLLIANAGAAVAYAGMAWLTGPAAFADVLLVTSYGMAISSTICGALLVEQGRKFGTTGLFVGQQWLWFNAAIVATSVAGGLLVDHLTPVSALHVAALIAAVAPMAVMAGSLRLLDEDKSRMDLPALRSTLSAVTATLTSRKLWVIALFLFLYYFSPGFGTPLYFYLSDRLGLSQSYIGVLGAITSIGWIAGALLHRWALERLSLKALLNLSILGGTAATLSFLALHDAVTAAMASFLAGVAAMIANIATLTLAADYCPKRSEGFTFAALMAVMNLADPISNNAGAYLFDNVFHSEMAPLILVSAAATAFAFVLVPLLGLGNKAQGEPAEA
jgi:predicted MFS family arabinose efflux permease